jgi:hypothetical protein
VECQRACHTWPVMARYHHAASAVPRGGLRLRLHGWGRSHHVGAACCEPLLCTLKAGPAGGRLRRPSSAGSATAGIGASLAAAEPPPPYPESVIQQMATQDSRPRKKPGLANTFIQHMATHLGPDKQITQYCAYHNRAERLKAALFGEWPATKQSNRQSNER